MVVAAFDSVGVVVKVGVEVGVGEMYGVGVFGGVKVADGVANTRLTVSVQAGETAKFSVGTNEVVCIFTIIPIAIKKIKITPNGPVINQLTLGNLIIYF